MKSWVQHLFSGTEKTAEPRALEHDRFDCGNLMDGWYYGVGGMYLIDWERRWAKKRLQRVRNDVADPSVGTRSLGESEWLVDPRKIQRERERLVDFQDVVSQALVRAHSFGMIPNDGRDECSIFLNGIGSAPSDEFRGKPLGSVSWLDSDLVDNDHSFTYKLKGLRPISLKEDHIDYLCFGRRPRGTYELTATVDCPGALYAGQLGVPPAEWDRLCSALGDEFAEQPIRSLTLTIRRDGFVPIIHTTESTDIQK